MEQILYLECNSGISGDMTVGALLDLGADRAVLEEAVRSLGIGGYHLHFGRTKKCGIDAYDFDVHLEQEYAHSHDHTHGQEHTHEHPQEHSHAHSHEGTVHRHEHHEEQEHEHSHHHPHEEHPHGHEHHPHEEHPHGHEHHPHGEHAHEHFHEHSQHHPHEHRNLPDIIAVIDRLQAGESVKKLAVRMFEIVAEAESRAHGIPVEEVHFHEVGAVDSIIDIVSTAVCLDNLGITKVAVSPLAEGNGCVKCQHGVMPVPVPATANIAAACGLELKRTESEGEMVTPTGAAIAAALRNTDLPKRYRVRKIGNGAGTKDFAHANILRAMLIEPIGEETAEDRVWKLETNLDDCTGENLGFVMEQLLEAGALDVWFTPIYMKKNRPAYQLSVLCRKEERERMEAILFRHTTTLGIRRCEMERSTLERETGVRDTSCGPVKVKSVVRDGKTVTEPEYESIREISRRTGEAFPQAEARLKEECR